MADIEKVKKGIFEMLQRNTWKDIDDKRHRFQPVLNDALELLKEQQEEIERLKTAKNKVIEKLEIKIETRKVYRTGYFLGITDGLNTALDILKGKDGEQE